MPVIPLFTLRAKWCLLAEAKRWNTDVGSAFDGSFGVDSQDILSIPEISLGSFQLFPDQNDYGSTGAPFTSPSSEFDLAITLGIEWIQAQADLSVR